MTLTNITSFYEFVVGICGVEIGSVNLRFSLNYI